MLSASRLTGQTVMMPLLDIRRRSDFLSRGSREGPFARIPFGGMFPCVWGRKVLTISNVVWAL